MPNPSDSRQTAEYVVAPAVFCSAKSLGKMMGKDALLNMDLMDIIVLYYMYYNVCIYYIYSNKYDQTKNNMDILHCLQLHLVTPSFRERTAGFWSPALV